VDGRGRTIADVLSSIAGHYRAGTPNGIRMDEESALIWSPSHFTWMDTNFPAATPREGYPIEIQVLWIRLLRQLERIGAAGGRQTWGALGGPRAKRRLQNISGMEDSGLLCRLADREDAENPRRPRLRTLHCEAMDSLPSVLASSPAGRAQRCVDGGVALPRRSRGASFSRAHAGLAATASLRRQRPSAERSDRTISGPLTKVTKTRGAKSLITTARMDLDFPRFLRSIGVRLGFSPHAIAAAKAYLGSMERLMDEGCLGQIPEILDGDAPHQSRGCDAQAWGVTEALRVWKLLDRRS